MPRKAQTAGVAKLRRGFETQHGAGLRDARAARNLFRPANWAQSAALQTHWNAHEHRA